MFNEQESGTPSGLCLFCAPAHTPDTRKAQVQIPPLLDLSRGRPFLPGIHCPFFVKKLPLAQETTNKAAPLAAFSPHQLWGLGDGSTICTTAAARLHLPAQLLCCPGGQAGAGANSKMQFLGLAQGHSHCPPLPMHYQLSAQEGNGSAVPPQMHWSSVTHFSITEHLWQFAIC